jgi:putative ABC transport system permease protein
MLANIRLGLRNLLLHKLRSLLTALGIIFGVTAVIVMVAIGQGAKEQARAEMDRLGPRNIVIRSTLPPESTEAGNQSRMSIYGLTREDLARLETVPGVRYVVPMRDTGQPVIRGDTRAPTANTIATTPELFETINLELARGQYFTQDHYDNAAAVAVIGAEVARKLFPYDDPLGQGIRLGNADSGSVTVTIVGVMKPTGLSAGSDKQSIIDRDIDSDVYLPMTLSRTVVGDTLFKREQGALKIEKVELTEVWLQANSIETVEKIAGIAEKAVNLPERQDAVLQAPIQLLRAAERQQAIFNYIMVTIACFSLVVGGIGIMNIMLATVTERTKEIGIRRALGAKRRHITLQFLIETSVISLSGGLMGVALGTGGALLLPKITGFFSENADYTTSVTTWSVVGSFIISGLIGVVFGLYPAIKAAHMSPIEALRHD